MGFKSVNEIDRFAFDDCVIRKSSITEGAVVYEVEALIIKSSNSQNTNYTDSYADTASIMFENGNILTVVKDGYREYDANDVLLSETPDVTLEGVMKAELLGHIDNMYLSGIEKIPESEDYVVFLEEQPSDPYDTARTDTYQLRIACNQVVVTWDRYLNRVER